jgi:hypothetical protein
MEFLEIYFPSYARLSSFSINQIFRYNIDLFLLFEYLFLLFIEIKLASLDILARFTRTAEPRMF